MQSKKLLVVVGGGAAGFFCAVNAARMSSGLKVVIIEKTAKLLSKVKISGGGRCNVTHACFDISDMSRRYPRGGNFVKKMFYQFFTTDIIQWFDERGVVLKTENDGRMFPVTDSSQTIIDCLLREAGKYHIDILLNREVKEIKKDKKEFEIIFQDSKSVTADYICVACGGYPKLSMFEWLTKTRHSIEEPVPSLFTLNMPGNPITGLMGISVENVKIKIAGAGLEQQGPVLITHWGLSGPAVLKLSAWAAKVLKEKKYEFTLMINWLPEFSEQHIRELFQKWRSMQASLKVIGRNNFLLPMRLWEFLAKQSGVTAEMRWADLPSAVQNRFIKNLSGFECAVKGKTTFKEEFVTAGGIRLNEVDVNTMMSKKEPGLFFAGEVLDVDGITGGYNFQHAWTSGWIAAKAIAGLTA